MYHSFRPLRLHEKQFRLTVIVTIVTIVMKLLSLFSVKKNLFVWKYYI